MEFPGPIEILSGALAWAHLIESLSDWQRALIALYITAPLVVAGGLFVMGMMNPPLALGAGLLLAAAKGSAFDMGKDTFMEVAGKGPSGLVARFAGGMSKGLGYLGLLDAMQESANRFVEVFGNQVANQGPGGPWVPRSSSPSIGTTVRAPHSFPSTGGSGWRVLTAVPIETPGQLAQALGVNPNDLFFGLPKR